jgi:tetratricopeptide (TPR) repeat protein
MTLPRRATRPWSSADTASVGAVLLAVAVVFAQVAGFQFVSWDDNYYVLENAKVWSGLGIDNLQWAWTTRFYGLWHPTAWLSHMLDATLWGDWAGGHHLSSVVVHGAGSVLLYLFFREATGGVWRSAAVALLFAVHPLHVESVAWISERKDVLCGFFWIAAMVAHGRYARAPTWRRYLFTLLWTALALTAKPMAVMLPAALLLVDLWPLQRLGDQHRGRALLRLLLEKLPLGLLVALYFVFFLQAPVTAPQILPLDLRLANTAIAYWTYLYQTVVPTGLSFYYPLVMAPASWAAPLGYGVFVLLLAAFGWWFRARPYLAVGLVWYLVTLLPVIGFIPIAAHAHADRYTYLPLIGIFALLAWALPSPQGRTRRAAWLAVAVLLVALAWRQAQTWKDSVSLYANALRVNQNDFMAHLNLADEWVRQGRLDDASAHVEQVTILAFGRELEYAAALVRGEIALAQERPMEALQHFNLARQIDPSRPSAFDRIGLALIAAGSPASADAYFVAALRGNPTNSASLAGRGLAALATGNVADARRHAGYALAGPPLSSEAIKRTARLFKALGENGIAAPLVARGLRRYPDDAALAALDREIGRP